MSFKCTSLLLCSKLVQLITKLPKFWSTLCALKVSNVVRILVLDSLHFPIFLENCQKEKCIRNGILRRRKHLKSSNNKYQLHLRENGNLVLACGGRPIWSSYTTHNAVDFLYFDEDGKNLVLYGKDNSIIWRALTTELAKKLVVQDDGKLVLYNACNTSIWERGNKKKCLKGLVRSIFCRSI